MDVYDKIRAVGDSEGWTERTQLLVLSEFIESIKPHFMSGLNRLDEFLETKREASLMGHDKNYTFMITIFGQDF